MPTPTEPGLPGPTTTRAKTPAPAPRPFLKWAGGKTQLLPEIRKRLPDGWERGTYHEPFVGGGAVFFALRPPRARLTDANEELINCWQVVQGDVEKLIAALAKIAGDTTRDAYERIRAQTRGLTDVRRAARLIFLNKTGYNGLYRVNRQGLFNVPYGRYANPTVCDPDNLRACSAALAGTELAVAPFEDVLGHARVGDFVYFDPPYQPVSATASFTGYYRDGFDEAKQWQLAGVFADLRRAGCHVLLSNSDTPLIHELYAPFTIERVRARRAINSDPGKRGKVYEVLVSSNPVPGTG